MSGSARASIPALGGAAVVVMVAVLALNFIPLFDPGGPPMPSPSATASPSTSPRPTTPASEAEVTELMNGFLEARVAGEGAQQYLNLPEEDIPLLYATTSGAPYERAEFERVLGIEWPYGFMAFKVRLFAGDTVVEQLVFTPADGRLGLEYDPHGFATFGISSSSPAATSASTEVSRSRRRCSPPTLSTNSAS